MPFNPPVFNNLSLDKVPAKEGQWNVRVSGDNSWRYLLFLLISVLAKQRKAKLGLLLLIMIESSSLLFIPTIIRAFMLVSLTKLDALFTEGLGQFCL